MSTLHRKAAQQHQLFETAAFYDINQFRDEELIMLILDKSVPARSKAKVHVIIKELLEEHEGLPGVIDIDIAELSGAYNLDQHTAIQIKAIVEIAGRLCRPREQRFQILCAEDAVCLLRPALMHLKHEELHLLVLDTKNQVMHWEKALYKGTVNSTALRIAEIFRPAIVRNAPNIILAHNHPSLNPNPSLEDLDITKQIVEAGKLLDITLLDHIIVGQPGHVSLKERLKW